MDNNDIFRRVRYIFDYDDNKMMNLFQSVNLIATRAQVSDWLKKEDDADHLEITDVELATFLNAVIIDKRGKKEGPDPIPESRLNNNIIFRKLRIALNYKDEDILGVLDSVDMNISKHELSAFFRNPTQEQFRPCKDQILRNFLFGLQLKLRPEQKNTSEN
ncbi:MAG: DUF1456 family protein [Flavobacteriales bacterium]|nr:DUF1456 family protein [Flavobacteriales bacterium]